MTLIVLFGSIDCHTPKWVFGAKTTKGKLETQYFAVSTPIRRHPLIKGEANPYDPKWREYFGKRQRRAKANFGDKHIGNSIKAGSSSKGLKSA